MTMNDSYAFHCSLPSTLESYHSNRDGEDFEHYNLLTRPRAINCPLFASLPLDTVMETHD